MVEHAERYCPHTLFIIITDALMLLIWPCPERPVESELTGNNHMKKGDAFTASAMFKSQKTGMIAEPWRILRAAARGKELLPEQLNAYRKKS